MSEKKGNVWKAKNGQHVQKEQNVHSFGMDRLPFWGYIIHLTPTPCCFGVNFDFCFWFWWKETWFKKVKLLGKNCCFGGFYKSIPPTLWKGDSQQHVWVGFQILLLTKLCGERLILSISQEMLIAGLRQLCLHGKKWFLPIGILWGLPINVVHNGEKSSLS